MSARLPQLTECKDAPQHCKYYMHESMMPEIRVFDALIAWRNHILQKDVFYGSRIDTFSSMVKMIEFGILKLEQPLSELMRISLEEIKQKLSNITVWTKATQLSKFKVFYYFSNFCKISLIGQKIIPLAEFNDLSKVIISELLSPNLDKLKSQDLTLKDISDFLNEMRNMNHRDCLICWMMWEYKCTLNHILDLRIQDIDLNKGISLGNEYRIGVVRPDLAKCISEQSQGKSDSDLLFVTDKGKRIHPGQLSRNMKTASKRAKLPVMLTPKILFSNAIHYAEKTYWAIPQDDREKLAEGCIEKLHDMQKKRKQLLENNKEAI